MAEKRKKHGERIFRKVLQEQGMAKGPRFRLDARPIHLQDLRTTGARGSSQNTFVAGKYMGRSDHIEPG